jgi:hypothetical protein
LNKLSKFNYFFYRKCSFIEVITPWDGTIKLSTVIT